MGAKKKLLILLYHGNGHFNAAFQLLHELKDNFDVVVAGIDFFKEHCEANGLPFITLKSYPFGIGLEKWINQQEKRSSYSGPLMDRYSNRLFRERCGELNTLLKVTQPYCVLLDAQLNTDFVAMYPALSSLRIRLSILHTMVPQTLSINKKPWWAKLKKESLQNLLYLFQSDARLIARGVAENQVPDKYISNAKAYLGITLQNIPEIILAPLAFRSTSVGNNYMGFHPYFKRRDFITDEYPAMRQRLHALRDEGKRIVYCSLGTVVNNSGQHKVFFMQLASVIAKLGAVLVISYPFIDQLSGIENNTNIFICKSVPQLDLLTFTDLFITHGGLNSISESIHSMIPMLIASSEFKLDQPFNAQRCEELGIALRINLIEVKPKELEEKINHLLSDQQFKNNIKDVLKHNPPLDKNVLAAFFDDLQPLSL